MRRRLGQLTFILLNVLISLGVALAVIQYNNSQNPPSESQLVITVPILVTATVDANQPTQTPFIITTTPLPGTPRVAALPTGLIDEAGGASTAPTIDPTILGASVEIQATASALPQGCVLHTLKEGEFPSAIAEQYGVDMFELMEVNELDDTSAAFLQIGQVLIVPLEGCTLTASALNDEAETEEVDAASAAGGAASADATDEAQPSVTPTPSRTPTATLPPTAVNAQVAILRVISPGNVTVEGVEIQNNGPVVEITGWTLTDSGGNVYTFGEQRLFTNGRVIVYTRSGTDTPSAKYWNRDTAVLSPGATLTLSDEDGAVQSTYIVP